MYPRLHTLHLTGLLLLTASGLAGAQTTAASQDKLVHDGAHVLPIATVQQLEQRLERYADSTGVQLAIVTVASLHGQEVSLVGDSIKKAWGVGSKETQRGLLYLIAPNEHRQTIRTGRGLEADLPDALCFRILKQTEPGMGQNMELAIVNRVTAIQQQLARAARAEAARGTPTLVSAPAATEPGLLSGWLLAGVLVLAGGVVLCVWKVLRNSPAPKAMARPGLGPGAFIGTAYSQIPTSKPGGRGPTAKSPDTTDSTGDSTNAILVATILAGSDEDEKKRSSSSESWGGWGSGSNDSGNTDGFNFGGDTNIGGGGGDGSW